MRGPLLYLVLLLSWIALSGPARADGDGSIDARKVAVLPLVIEGSIDDDAKAGLLNGLRAGLERGEFAIVPQGDVDVLADDPCDRQTCYGKLRAELEVSHLVRVTVVVENRDYELSLELIDVENGEVVASSEERCDICGLEEVGELLSSQGALLRAKIDAMGAGPAVLIIDSKPTGATVMIDGEIVGVTPVERSVIAGEHVLRVSADGFVAEEREITFVPGVTETLTLDLDRAVGSKKMRILGAAAVGGGVLSLGGAALLLFPSNVLVTDDDGNPVLDENGDKQLTWVGANIKFKCKDETAAPDNCPEYRNYAPLGGILAAAGGALTTLGVVLLLRHRKPRSSKKASASAMISPTGIWLQGRF